MMKKKTGILFLALIMMFCTACSSGQKPDVKQMQAFYTAFNQMLEAKTLYAKGKVSSGNFQTGFTLWIDQDKRPLEIAFATDPVMGKNIAFYVKDGKTYLDFMGTKSQSVASNLGIDKNTSLSLYNPLQDLTDAEKEELFASAAIDGDQYSFQFNTSKLASFLDSFGALTLSKANMFATVQNGKIKSIAFSAAGTISMGDSKSVFDGRLELNEIKINESVDVSWPADLDSWPVQ
ncbi:MAG: hypothetical protein HUJ54_00985 [Erysipelotrichaceae bacterium]|nr:hypothetical protein [Erysipelotrichaceae bacterium]